VHDIQIIAVAQQHGHRICVEQLAKPFLALLQISDVDAHADSAAVERSAVVVPEPSAVAKLLFFLCGRQPELLHALDKPCFLVLDEFPHLVAGKVDLQYLLKMNARPKMPGNVTVEFCIFLVPKDLSALCVKNADRLRQHVENGSQADFCDWNFLFLCPLDIDENRHHFVGAAQPARDPDTCTSFMACAVYDATQRHL
jgi:hypothetical protein